MLSRCLRCCMSCTLLPVCMTKVWFVVVSAQALNHVKQVFVTGASSWCGCGHTHSIFVNPQQQPQQHNNNHNNHNNHNHNHSSNNNNSAIWGGSVLTGEEPPPHSGELKHALSQAGGPTQSQLSRPVSSGHHISMEFRQRRKQSDSDTNANKKKYLKEVQEKSKEETFSSEKMQKENEKHLKNQKMKK